MFAEKYLIRMLVVVALLLAGPAMALEQEEEVLMAGRFNLLAADIAMISYDPENADYLVQADDMLSMVSGTLPSWMEDLEPELYGQVQQDWSSLVDILRGSDGYPGLLEGYDLNLDAKQRVHYDSLQRMIFASAHLQDAELSDIERLYLSVTSVVAGYVTLTANPFGATAMSSNDDDSRVVILTEEIDALFAALIKSSDSPMKKQTLRRQQAKWQFVRGTVMQGSQTAMPYIVRFQGKQIADDLGLLIEEAI